MGLLDAVMGALGQGRGGSAAGGGMPGQLIKVVVGMLGNDSGSDTIANIARQLGVSQGKAAGQPSQILSQIVDRLTPQGQAPAGGLGNMGDLLGMLMKR